MSRVSEAAQALRGNGDAADAAKAGLYKELAKRQGWQSMLLAENLWKLELAQEDEGWRKLTMDAEREFSRDGIQRASEIARAMYLSNPLIKRAINVTAYYTWAQGAQITAKDDTVQENVVEPTITNPANRAELYSHQARLLTDVEQAVEGNLLIAMFTNAQGNVQLRSIPADEIREIFTDPEDRSQVWLYRRVWSQREIDPATGSINTSQHECYYPDWRYHPVNRPDTIGNKKVMWDAPVIHQRTGGLKHMQFGITEVYAALDWARAYKNFLEDWHTLVASLARFAWSKTTTASKLQEEAARLQSPLVGDEMAELTAEDAQPAGGIFVSTEDGKMDPIQKTGAHTSADDARAERLMVASATDLPDTFLSGDVDIGNFATSKTLDRPTELAMRSRQTMWNDFHADIFEYVCTAKVRAGTMPGRVLPPDDSRGQAQVEFGFDPRVEVVFPPILEHDMDQTVKAIVAAATLEGKEDASTVPRQKLAELLMNAIGVEDVEAAMAELETQHEEDEAKQADQDAQDAQMAVDALKLAQQKPPTGAVPSPKPKKEPPDA